MPPKRDPPTTRAPTIDQSFCTGDTKDIVFSDLGQPPESLHTKLVAPRRLGGADLQIWQVRATMREVVEEAKATFLRHGTSG